MLLSEQINFVKFHVQENNFPRCTPYLAMVEGA